MAAMIRDNAVPDIPSASLIKLRRLNLASYVSPALRHERPLDLCSNAVMTSRNKNRPKMVGLGIPGTCGGNIANNAPPVSYSVEP
jgi:hypothetical protein